MIEVSNLSKVYRVHEKKPGLMGSIESLFKRQWLDKKAVKGANLNIKQGEIVGLVGANGAGKTTLVKMLSGIIYPTSGDAKVLGYTPWERKDAMRRQIALVMGQKAQLWWDLPAADCFLLLKEIYRIPESIFEENIKTLSEKLDVVHLLNTQIRRLSLGERMKMELMAALLHNPKVLFLDEPTIGLDLNAQRAIRRFLLDYQKKHNVAMILTSHYMEDIEKLCKRIIIISEGDIIYDGALQKVVTRYATEKLLTVTPEDRAEFNDKSGLIHSLGYPYEDDENQWKIKVPRGKATEVASQILQGVKVSDINIEEQEISDIIAAILGEKSML